MMASMVIVFREMLEMVLVIGILLAATGGMAAARYRIALGTVLGLCGAVVVALLMEQMENAFDGEGEFLFNAIVLFLASIMLAWTVLWMSRHSREVSSRLKRVGVSVAEGTLPQTALLVVSFAAVMREGSEAVFFLFGAARSLSEDGSMFLMGGILGAVVALLLGYIMYAGLVRIPVQYLFRIAGWLLMLLAAGMASQAVWNLVVIDRLPALIDHVWNLASWLPQDSLVGELLHVMVGYDEAPSGMQLLVFLLFLGVLSVCHYRLQRAIRPQPA